MLLLACSIGEQENRRTRMPSIPTVVYKDYPLRWDGVTKVEVRGLSNTPAAKDVTTANATSDEQKYQYLYPPGGWKSNTAAINIEHVAVEGKNKNRVVRKIFRPAEKPVVQPSTSIYNP